MHTHLILRIRLCIRICRSMRIRIIMRNDLSMRTRLSMRNGYIISGQKIYKFLWQGHGATFHRRKVAKGRHSTAWCLSGHNEKASSALSGLKLLGRSAHICHPWQNAPEIDILSISPPYFVLTRVHYDAFSNTYKGLIGGFGDVLKYANVVA